MSNLQPNCCLKFDFQKTKPCQLLVIEHTSLHVFHGNQFQLQAYLQSLIHYIWHGMAIRIFAMDSQDLIYICAWIWHLKVKNNALYDTINCQMLRNNYKCAIFVSGFNITQIGLH